MRILRPFLIGLLSFLCIASIGLIVYVGTLQLTILDRTVVKSWLRDGGVYENKLFPTLMNPDASTGQSAPNQYGIPVEALRLALERTFTKDYVQSQTETTIDKFYDWLNGKTKEFAFTIPINEKRDTFIAEFTRAGTPYVAALPICTTSLAPNTPCRPARATPELYTLTVVTSIVEQSKFFQQPISSESIPQNSSPALQSLTLLKSLVPYSIIILICLGILAIASAITHLWLITPTRRLHALAHLGKRVFFSQAFTLAAALFLLWAFYSGFFKLPGLPGDQPAVIRETINAVVKLTATDFAGKLALLSGIICAVGLALWIAITIYRRRRTQVSIVDESEESSSLDNNS